MTLLPDDFDSLINEAVSMFWATKLKTTTKSQGGTRSSVLSGKHLDGFLEITKRVVKHGNHNGIRVVTQGRDLKIPGYFRATKCWDALIYHNNGLVAAIEFKSQVGSFGNNQNNRIEEVIGLGHDFWTANKYHAFTPSDISGELLAAAIPCVADKADPRPPFLGYFMLLESTPRSCKPMDPSTGQFAVDNVYKGASYADRYRIMAERLMSERLFTSVSVMMSEQSRGAEGRYDNLSKPTSIRALYTGLAAHLETFR